MACSRNTQATHFDQRHQEGQGRLCSLVLIHSLRVQSISTTAGDGIVEGNLQVILPQKPVEGRPGAGTPPVISGCAIRFEARGDGATCFHWLLIEASFLASLAVEPLGTDGHEMLMLCRTLSL